MKSVKIILHAARCTQIIVKIEIIMPRPAPPRIRRAFLSPCRVCRPATHAVLGCCGKLCGKIKGRLKPYLN